MDRNKNKTSVSNNIMGRGEETVVTRANTKSDSLRTTVPKGIVKQFDIKEGDSIFWEIKPSPDGKGLVVVVSTEPNKKPKAEND